MQKIIAINTEPTATDECRRGAHITHISQIRGVARSQVQALPTANRWSSTIGALSMPIKGEDDEAEHAMVVGLDLISNHRR